MVVESRSREAVNQGFLEILKDALDIFGTNVSNVVFYMFEQKTTLNRSEICFHPEEFVNALRSMFGDGSHLVEKSLVESFGGRFPDLNSLDLLNALRRLRRHLVDIKESKHGFPR